MWSTLTVRLTEASSLVVGSGANLLLQSTIVLSTGLLAAVMLSPLASWLDRVSPLRAFVGTWFYTTCSALILARWLSHALAVEYAIGSTRGWVFTTLVVGLCALPSGGAAIAGIGCTSFPSGEAKILRPPKKRSSATAAKAATMPSRTGIGGICSR